MKAALWEALESLSDLLIRQWRRALLGLVGLWVLFVLGVWLFTADPPALAASAERRLREDDVMGAVLDARSSLQDNPAFLPGRLALTKALLASGDLDGAVRELERAEEGGLKAHEAAGLWGAIGLAKGNLQEVEDRLSRVTDAPPAVQADLLVLRSRAQALLGRQAEAGLLLKQALGLQPAHSAAILQRARQAAAQGDRRLAEDLVHVAITKDPDSADAWLLKGDLARHAGQPAADAADFYSKALTIRPRMDLAHERLVLLALSRQDTKAAAAYAEAMGKALPNHVMGFHLKALVAYTAGQYREAREYSQRTLKMSRGFAPALMLTGLAERRLGSPVQAETFLNKAIAALPDASEPRRELADLQLAAGRGADALETLAPVLAAKPQAGDWRMAGRAHSLQGAFRKADEAFGRAAKLDPTDTRVAMVRGFSLLERGAVDQGLKELQQAAAAQGSSAGIDMALVSALMAQRRFDAAEKAAGELIRKQPTALAHLLLGQIQVARANKAGATEAFQAALAVEPGFLPAVAGLAQLEVDAGQFKAARQRYEAVLKKDPRSAQAMLALAAITRLEGGTRAAAAEWLDKAVTADPGNPRVWQQAVDQQRRTGDLEGARERARRAVASLPDDPGLQASLGHALSALGDHQQAVAAYSAWAKLRPGAHEPRLRLAQALVTLKRPEAARVHVMKAVELAPDAPAVLRSHAALLIHEKRAPALQALVDRTKKRLPKSAIGWQLEAEKALAAGDSKLAIKALKAAVTKGDASEAALMLARIYAKESEPAAARTFQDQWLRDHPEDRPFLLHVANQAMAAKDWDRAEPHFKRLLELEPNDPLVMNNLAYVLVQRKDKAALALAERAVRAAPDLAAVVDTLALAYATDAKLKQAIEWQTRAVELEPKVPVYRLQLARYQLQAGEKSKARAQLERIRDLGDAFPAQDVLRELLAQAGA